MVKKIKNLIVNNQLVVFIILAVAIAAFTTWFSVWLYVADGSAKLDFSRPGFEDLRKKISDKNDDTTKDYSSTGELNSSSVKDFKQRFNSLKDSLNQANNFDESTLSDENLGLDGASATYTENTAP